MSTPPPLADLNAHKYVTVISMEESGDTDWALRIVVTEERLGEPCKPEDIHPETPEEFRELLLKSRSIEATPDSAVYEICFASYVIYTVTDESFAGSGDWNELEGGPHTFICRGSSLLKHAQEICWDDNWRASLTHYCLSTSDHIVEIVTKDEPVVRRLGGDA